MKRGPYTSFSLDMYSKADRQEALIGPSLYRRENLQDHVALRSLYDAEFDALCERRAQPIDVIADRQFARIAWLVRLAFDTVGLYREKYSDAGFEPGDLRTWADFVRLPTLTKDELIAGWPDLTISSGHDTEFMTSSSGSSGRFVYLAVSEDAIRWDTLQGARQLRAQSAGLVGVRDLTVMINTCEWWYSSIDGLYPTHFLPTCMPVDEAIGELVRLRPAALAVYPSYLEEIVAASPDALGDRLRLVIVHSEASTRSRRMELAEHLGTPVLDEYSSEELTRIALECPAGRYHLEEDACYTEILSLDSDAPCDPGETGEVVGTNLLNEATPLIRYRQGDFAHLTTSLRPCACGCTFRTISAPLGRIEDSFPTPSGRLVPAAALLDEAYNWTLKARIPMNGVQYLILQSALDHVDVYLRARDASVSVSLTEPAIATIRERMRLLLGVDTSVDVHSVEELPPTVGTKTRAVVSLVAPGPTAPSSSTPKLSAAMLRRG
jgi:phenylacetate-CoA ligase